MILQFKSLYLFLFILHSTLTINLTNGELILNTTAPNNDSYDTTPITDLESPLYIIIETFSNIELRKYNPSAFPSHLIHTLKSI